MRQLLIILGLCSYFSNYAQQANTEVFLYDLEIKSATIELKNPKNLSNNEGYDNQPSFLNDRYIIFASTRNNQTDIAKYDTRYDSKSWINFSEGGEYTPLKISGSNEISAVRLDPDGKQRLYAYNMSNGESRELISELVVAYYTWADDHTVVSAVIEDENLNLYTTNVQEKSSRKYATKVGRSFHKIPNTDLVSFISKQNEQWQIKSLNPDTGDTKIIANTMTGVEDICWLDSKTILSGKDSILYKLTLNRDNDWKQVTDLSPNGISKITRLATNPEGTKLLVAGDISASTESTENTTQDNNSQEDSNSENTNTQNDSETSSVESIIQRNLDAYNARDIDAFMADYADNVKLYAYPNTLQTDGKEAMRKSYKDWFDRVTDLKATIKKRIVIVNKVIDEEEVSANGQTFHAVAIYEVNNGKITKVTFIQ